MEYSEIFNSDTAVGDLPLSDARRKALAIIGDLTDRKGLKHEWENIDEDIQDEIFQMWVSIIERDASPKVDVTGDAAERMKLLEARYEGAARSASTSEDQVYEAEGDIDALVQETVHQLFPEMDKDALSYRVSGWECEEPNKNPFPLCVYNHEEDPCLDDCLFCHQPYERK
jgi:hypothetical protein